MGRGRGEGESSSHSGAQRGAREGELEEGVEGGRGTATTPDYENQRNEGESVSLMRLSSMEEEENSCLKTSCRRAPRLGLLSAITYM